MSTVEDRFWPKVARGDQCWLWTGATSHGYGLLSAPGHAGTPLKAHRVSWELHHGPIPDGLWVLHHCDVRSCVRPDHLFLGTNADNMADAVSKGRYFEPQRRHSKLNVTKVRAIKDALRSGETNQSVADRYGLSNSTVSLIRTGRLWRDVA